jgi:hypothetical protein
MKFLNYWKCNLIFGAKRAWKWMGVKGIIFDVVISFLAGLIIGQNNLIYITLITIGTALVIYIILVLTFAVSIVPFQENTKLEKVIANYKILEEPPEIQRLAEYHTEGVRLRNSGEGLTDPDHLALWINNYTKWDNDVLSTLSKLSKGKSEWLRTLDRMPIQGNRKAINPEHLQYLSIFDEKLRRLDMILRKYLDLI